MMPITSAISKLTEIKKKELQEQLDKFYERMGLGIIHPVNVAAKPEPGMARKGFRARKGQKTEKDEQLPKHLRYR